MTVIDTTSTVATTPAPAVAVALDLYRDIHKGIRSELFGVTEQAGRTDASAISARSALAAHVGALVDLLGVHAGHEDRGVQPAIEVHLPWAAERIAVEHPALEARMEVLRDMAGAAVGAARAEQRHHTHQLYLELASFTSAYLAHQDLEERVVMPALAGALGFDTLLAIHTGIIRSIPPELMASSLALMLPAMNVDDRTELLGGMRADTPPAVFEGVWGLAGSVLAADDRDAVAVRLGLDPRPVAPRPA